MYDRIHDTYKINNKIIKYIITDILFANIQMEFVSYVFIFLQKYKQ